MGISQKEFFVKDMVIDDEYGIIDSEASIFNAANKMKDLGIPDLVVVEKGSNKILGVLADFDIVQNIVAEGKDPKKENVKSVMYVIKPVTLATSVKEAFERMRDLNVNVVPVEKEGKLIGVCSIQDCWSYIPDERKDDVGLIPVKDAKTTEFWFGSICASMAFILGVLLPLIGGVGFFSADPANLMNLLGIANVRGSQITFFLFDARGGDFIIPYTALISKSNAIWLLIVILSYFILIFGILALISIIYSGLASIKNIKRKELLQRNIPSLLILLLILQWILISVGLFLATPLENYMIDIPGLILSILSMGLMVAAMMSDHVFRQKDLPKTATKEG